MFPNGHIVNGSENNYPGVNGDTPVHRARDNGGGRRKEVEHEERDQETHGADVDEYAVAAKRPSSGRESFSTKAFDDDAADGDEVGGEQADCGEREDGVESEGGANIDEGQENGDDKGNDDGVEGDVPRGRNLTRSVLESALGRVCTVGLTCEMTDENGTPLSRANAHNCREAVAISAIQLEVSVKIRIAVITFVPARLWVVL